MKRHDTTESNDTHANENIERTRRFLRAIEENAAADEIAAFFHPDALHTQAPNAIYPRGVTQDVSHMRAGAEAGKKLLARQRYEVTSALADGDRVAVEVTWTGVLAVPMKHLPAGATLVAHCGMFLVWREGRIAQQRNYDCYEPF